MATNIRNLASRVEPGQRLHPRGSPKDTAPDQAADARRSFLEELKRAQQQDSDVRLSAHAEKRIEQREIPFGASDRQSVHEAMLRLSEKGARDAVLLNAEAAFVVNVPERTVVTAMDRQEMEDRVFTNIDSALLLSR
jgi:flagellar operon protein